MKFALPTQRMPQPMDFTLFALHEKREVENGQGGVPGQQQVQFQCEVAATEKRKKPVWSLCAWQRFNSFEIPMADVAPFSIRLPCAQNEQKKCQQQEKERERRMERERERERESIGGARRRQSTFKVVEHFEKLLKIF